MTDLSGRIWLITGPREVGKTRFCTHLVTEAQKRGLKIAGVLSPPRWVDGQKTAIEIINLSNQEQWVLATRRVGDESGMGTEHWVFDPEVTEWGNQVLSHPHGCDLLIIDELGPLELLHGAGWQKAFSTINDRKYQVAVVVIRPELLEKGLGRWPEARILKIDPEMDERSESALIEQVIDSVSEAKHQ
ncbi:MAG: hypothetical protein NTZ74_14415 [Chloroflexi bacterium]|nr:hypothetical protein [Chloroflexota bacterium]